MPDADTDADVNPCERFSRRWSATTTAVDTPNGGAVTTVMVLLHIPGTEVPSTTAFMTRIIKMTVEVSNGTKISWETETCSTQQAWEYVNTLEKMRYYSLGSKFYYQRQAEQSPHGFIEHWFQATLL